MTIEERAKCWDTLTVWTLTSSGEDVLIVKNRMAEAVRRVLGRMDAEKPSVAVLRGSGLTIIDNVHMPWDGEIKIVSLVHPNSCPFCGHTPTLPETEENEEDDE